VTAVRDGAELPRTAAARRAPFVGAAVGMAGIAGLAVSLMADLETRPRIIMMVLGLLATFLGIAALMPRIVRPLTRVIGGPVGRLGGQPGRLGTENAMRNPGRTASTAAALMIGLALMTFVAVLGTGLKSSDRNALGDQISATHVISKSTGFENLTPGTDRAAATAAGAEIVSGVRSATVKVGDNQVAANGVDPSAIVSLYRFDWDRGSNAVLTAMSGNQAIVSHDFAKDRNLVVGSSFTVQSASGATGTLRVAGTYTPKKLDSLMSPIVMTQTAFDSLVPRASDSLVLARMAGGDQAGSTALTAALGAYPDGTVLTASAFVNERAKDIDTLLNLLYVLLALSVVVSMFGMINTLALAVIERTRELGLLRAVGMSRRQVRRMVRSESITTALIGAVMGLPIGIGLAALVTRALDDYDVGFTLPVTGLVTLTIVAVAAGILAAVAPGRRAARLDVLRALQYE
jgi:putative ABC transport system permease protein